jgi:hypothetical protein
MVAEFSSRHLCLRTERYDLSRDAPTNLPAVHRRRSNCQEGTGTDTPRRLVDGEACECLGIKKRGVTPLSSTGTTRILNYVLAKVFAV